MNTLPYLKFNDKKCREAMDFYKKAFGGEVELTTLGESGMKDNPEAKNMDMDKIMHAKLTVDGKIMFYAADMMRDKATVGDNVDVSVNFGKGQEAKAKKLFDALKPGGDVFMDIQKVPWGTFGSLTDKYGIEWMVNVSDE